MPASSFSIPTGGRFAEGDRRSAVRKGMFANLPLSLSPTLPLTIFGSRRETSPRERS